MLRVPLLGCLSQVPEPSRPEPAHQGGASRGAGGAVPGSEGIQRRVGSLSPTARPRFPGQRGARAAAHRSHLRSEPGGLTHGAGRRSPSSLALEPSRPPRRPAPGRQLAGQPGPGQERELQSDQPRFAVGSGLEGLLGS